MQDGEATTTSDLFGAIKKGDRAAVERLLERDPSLAGAREEGGVSALLTALYHGKADIAAVVLARAPRLDVFEAAATGDVDRVRQLLDGDPSLLNAYAPDGFHPLGLAAFFRRPEVVRLLVERGADVTQASRNQLRVTPLHSAVATDAAPTDMPIIHMLLDAGAPVNVPHLGSGTPLHAAAFVGDPRVVRALLDRGADPTTRTEDGKTAADIARERTHASVAEMLDAAAARR